MRHFTFLVLVIALSLLGATAVVWAQTGDPAADPSAPLRVTQHPGQMIDSGIPWSPPAELLALENAATPLTLMADEPADTCEEAPLLQLIPDLQPGDGGAATVNNFTIDPTDPVLSCVWGEPQRPQGYRTAWYQFTAIANGRVTFDTFSSTYDTVLQVYSGDCGELQPANILACNDDTNGFSSRVTMPVNAGDTYYIEVADWNQGIDVSADLRFSALLEPIDSAWKNVITSPQPPAISRHVAVANRDGENIFVIGGQTGESGLPIVSNFLYRLNTTTGVWTRLTDMPGPGYANTTAVLINGEIYVPFGDTGSPDSFGAQHWVYNIATDKWNVRQPITSNDAPFGVPFAWATAVARPNSDQYFLIGGLSSQPPFAAGAKVNDTVFLYTASTNSWSQKGDFRSMSSPRYAHTAVWLEGKGMCVAGGLNADATSSILVPTAECYLPGGQWQSIGEMKIPRYMADSVVGPDGRWYIFGGYRVVAGISLPTAVTEVYDPRTNQWSVLPAEYNLGGTLSSPSRVWPQGVVVGNTLWVIGGSAVRDGEQALPLVERLFLPSGNVYVPHISGNYDDFLRPDDSFETARPLAFGIPQSRNFDSQLDFYDVYVFNNPRPGSFTITLEVPDGADFDLVLYGENKFLRGRSNLPFTGADEQISLTTNVTKLYAVVERAFPTAQPNPGQVYRITLRR